MNCRIENCGKEANGSKGLCKGHYHKLLRYGDPLVTKKYKRICLVNDCNDFVLAHGYCNKHFLRWKRNGNPLSFAPRTLRIINHIKTICSFNGCENVAHSKGLCDRHYAVFNRNGEMKYKRLPNNGTTAVNFKFVNKLEKNIIHDQGGIGEL